MADNPALLTSARLEKTETLLRMLTETIASVALVGPLTERQRARLTLASHTAAGLLELITAERRRLTVAETHPPAPIIQMRES